MRIIAGTRKGHTIHAPKGLDTRPTSDRVRENVFNIVAPWVEGARVLAPDGLVVYQTDARTEPEVEGLHVRTSRKYGSARLTLFEA